MKRVVVLGPGGAGKTELATAISRRTGLPVVHLDVLFWGPGWTPAPAAEARAELERAVAGDRWILDGNFLATDDRDGRFARADTVIFLDLARAVCIRRVLTRLARDRRRRRPDLPDGCREGFDLPLLRWIWRYPATDRLQVLRLLEKLEPHVEVHHLRTPTDVRRYLEALPRPG